MIKKIAFFLGFCFASNVAFAQFIGEFNPLKEMQTVPNSSRVTVSSHLKTLLISRDWAAGTVYLDGLPMGLFNKENPIYTQEIPAGKHLVEVCNHLWYNGDDTKYNCVKMEVETEPNKLYLIAFRMTFAPFASVPNNTLDVPVVVPF